LACTSSADASLVLHEQARRCERATIGDALVHGRVEPASERRDEQWLEVGVEHRFGHVGTVDTLCAEEAQVAARTLAWVGRALLVLSNPEIASSTNSSSTTA
jgi:hypothetical protein